MVNVYYADDDQDDLDLFVEATKRIAPASLKLNTASSGEKLLSIIEQDTHTPGWRIVFLDINMPGKTGFDVLQHIRTMPASATTAVLMYSTSSNLELVAKSQVLGANHYIVKPNRFDELCMLLERIIAIDWTRCPGDDHNFILK